MSYLDAFVPQIHKSSTNFTLSTDVMHAIINTAEQQAQAAQAFNKGDHSVAFQAAHARFVSSAQRVRMLLKQAADHVQHSGAVYTATDASTAHNIGQSISSTI